MLAITMDFEVAQAEPGTKDLNDEEGTGGLTTVDEPQRNRRFYKRVTGRRRTRACPRVNRYLFDPPSQRAALEGSRFQLMPGDMENIPGTCSSYRGIF